jgi:hypothetical protein
MDPHVFGRSRLTLAGMVLSMSGCNQLAARDQLNKGVDAYKSATTKRRSSTSRRPRTRSQAAHGEDLSGHRAGPERGAGTDDAGQPEDRQQAIDIFKEVLAKDPNDVNSMKQIAGIYFSIKKLDDAKAGRRRFWPSIPRIPRLLTPSA